MTATMTPFIPTLRGNAGKASRIRGEGKIKGKLKGEFFFAQFGPICMPVSLFCAARDKFSAVGFFFGPKKKIGTVQSLLTRRECQGDPSRCTIFF